ncbi:MAG TPA: hypothetical protein PKM41_01495 [Deltaproteobacteria bacterium]|jgi:PleD family two-component response regulator|nr:hypothetical protein [Deltaproteobacteria bacterium]HOI07033.1 hypothetical protein [Deltaproteobacteria bacterium]
MAVFHEMSEAYGYVAMGAGAAGKGPSLEHLIRRAGMALCEAEAKERNRSEVRKES